MLTHHGQSTKARIEHQDLREGLRQWWYLVGSCVFGLHNNSSLIREKRYWNCYPGARVDSDAPIYQLFDKEIWEEFCFEERYPDWKELRRYFKYLDQKLKISEHTKYNCTVVGAKFNEETCKWEVKCADGSTALCRWFIPAIGFAAKKYVPPYKGLDKFKGEIHHTAVCVDVSWYAEGNMN